FDIGSEPGEAVGGALLAVERTLHGVVRDADPPANRGGCVPQHRLCRQNGLAREHPHLPRRPASIRPGPPGGLLPRPEVGWPGTNGAVRATSERHCPSTHYVTRNLRLH